jgi:hypothetical protein
VRGVLIEDENVRRLGASAEVREVAFGSAQVRVPTRAGLEDQLRAAVRMAQQQFEAEAARLAWGASFEIRALTEMNQLLSECGAEHLLIVGRARVPAARSWSDLALTRLLSAGFGGLAFVPADTPPVTGGVAYFQDGAHDEGAVRVASRIARRAALGLRPLALATLSRPPATPPRYLVVSVHALGLSRLREVISTCRSTVVVTP